MTEGYKFKINETEKLDNGCKYSISLELPMKDGWFEDVYFWENNSQLQAFSQIRN